MNVYDFAPDLDLSKEVVGVRGIEGSDGIVYAKVVSCIEIRDYSCDRCIDRDWCCRTGCHRGGSRRRLGLRPAVVGGT